MAVKNLQLLILSAIIVGIAFFGYIEIKKLNKKIDSMESKYEKLLLEEVEEATQKKKYLQQIIRNKQPLPQNSSSTKSVNEGNIQSILLQYAKSQQPSQQSYDSLQTQSNQVSQPYKKYTFGHRQQLQFALP